MATKLKAFDVYAKLSIEVSVPIKAESLADAVARSSELRESDFIEFLGEYIAGDVAIVGVLAEER